MAKAIMGRELSAAVSTLGMTAATLPQFALAALSPSIVGAIGLGTNELGLVLGCLFATGAIFTGVSGRMVDNSRRVQRLLIGLFSSSALALVIAAAATGRVSFYVAATVAGFSLALAYPLTNLVINAYVGSERTIRTLVGVKQSGGQFAAVIAGFALPRIAGMTSWRVALAIASIVPMIGLAASGSWAHEPSPESGPAGVGEASLFTDQTLRALSMYSFMMAAFASVVSTFATLYAFEEIQLSAGLAGMVTGTLGVSAFAARILIARYMSSMDRIWHWLSLIPLTSMAGVVVFAASPERSLVWITLGTMLMGASGFAWAAIVTTAVLSGSTRSTMGAISARIIRPALIAFALAPPVFGQLVAWSGSYRWVWAGVVLPLAVANMSARRLARVF